MTPKQFEALYKKFINDINSKQFKEIIAIEVIRIIRGRVGSGYGVVDDTKEPATKMPLKSLSPKYVQFRQKSANLSSLARPGKSNLTFTGQMLKSMTYDVAKGIRVYIPETTRKDGDLTNAEVAFFASLDRPFLALTDSELKNIIKLYERRIRQLIRIYFK